MPISKSRTFTIEVTVVTDFDFFDSAEEAIEDFSDAILGLEEPRVQQALGMVRLDGRAIHRIKSVEVQA